MRALAASLCLIFLPVPGAAQEFSTLKGHGGPIMDINVNPETGQVATASFDNSVGLWKGRSPIWLEGHEAAVNSVLFLGKDILLSGGDDFRVLLWSPTLSKPSEIAVHRGKVTNVAIFEHGREIASASWDGTIEHRSVIDPLGTSETKDPIHFKSTTLTGHDAGVNAIVFSGAGELYSASTDGTIRHWQIGLKETKSRVIVSHGFGINELVLNDKEGWLAYGSVDGMTRVIAPETGDTLADFTLERRPILSMAYHDATSQLAVGDGHGYIMMIDTATWQITRDFRAMLRGPVWALDFSPDGKTIYAGGLEDVAYSWPVALLDGYEPVDGPTRSFLRNPEDMPNGERQFMRKCSICHALTPPPSRKAGPSLYNLFGRRAGTVPDYPYSDILSGSDIIWSDDSIDALFDLGPDHYIPGSKMPMQRITAAQDRQDLIGFLRIATGEKEN
ncbi:Cytochrome c2 precursor [Roseovarius litorisediminis]|uniref:Cytochrome c2 n=1 Tax=Roseovarius litorisediminis TaxID=1312363 RepID=A0A1Y5SJA2_9RHOB|nr:c-type cytochrome [Roseovarius litorisediminis]SLN40425.1 Cytochrome c2 precursor [Roseovarius litorisediminis]